LDNDFVITPKEDKSVVVTIRVDKQIQEGFDKLAQKSNRSRNELITMSLQYALQAILPAALQ
jgi:predicted transcriptional regulator